MEEKDKKKIRAYENQINENNNTIRKCNNAKDGINSIKPEIETCLEYIEKIKTSVNKNLKVQTTTFDEDTLIEIKNCIANSKTNISNSNRQLESKIQSLKSNNNELQYKIRKIKKESGDS